MNPEPCRAAENTAGGQGFGKGNHKTVTCEITGDSKRPTEKTGGASTEKQSL